jgi:hypothetical protein
MDLAGGSWIFLAFLVLAIIVTAYAYYTVKGSGIGQRGWSDRDQAMGMTVGKDPSPTSAPGSAAPAARSARGA